MQNFSMRFVSLNRFTKIYIYVILLIPHYVAAVNKPGIPLISVSRIYIFFWFLIFVFKYTGNKFKNNVKYEQYPFTIPVVVLSVSLFLVSIFSQNSGVSFQAWIAILSENLIPSYLIWISFYNSKDIIKVFKTLIIIFIPIAIYGTFAELQSYNPVIDFIQTHFSSDTRTLAISYANYERLGIYGRAQSIFYHPIQYGCFLCFMLCILFHFSQNRFAFNKKLIVIIAFIFLYSLLLVRSRSPIVFLIVTGFVYWFFQKAVNRIRMTAFAVMLVSIFFYLQNQIMDNSHVQLFVSIFQELISHESLVRGSSYFERISKLNATLDIFSSHPLLGHGLGSMRDMVYLPNFGIRGAESFIFKLLIETGLVGIFGYLFFYTFLIQYFRNYIKFSRDLLFVNFSISTIALIFGYLSFICVTGEMKTFQYLIVIVTLSAKYLSCKAKEK